MLIIDDLSASASGKPVLDGISLEVGAGQVHAIMGPNGSGKSTLTHVLAGRPGYEVTGGSIELNGVSLTELSVSERAKAGLFCTQQYPIEVPGVTITELLSVAIESLTSKEVDSGLRDLIKEEMLALGMESHLLARSGVNVDFSGGESKRSEALQLAILKPKIAVLDELDSGLDLDAIEDIGKRIYKAVKDDDVGILAITHYSRLFDQLPATQIHVLVEGKIVETGGPELALELESTGYAHFERAADVAVEIRL